MTVPTILAHDTTHTLVPADFLLIEWLPSEPPPTDEALRTAGRQLRDLHETTHPGYGAGGRCATWDDVVEELLDDVTFVVEVGLLDAAVGNRIRTVTRRFLVGRYVESGVLLHGDLKLDHILSVGPRLTGIIDWGDATIGDPAWDLARASMMAPAAFAELLDGYGLLVTEHVRRVWAAYRALRGAWSLAGEYRAGGDWFAAYQDHVARDLAELY